MAWMNRQHAAHYAPGASDTKVQFFSANLIDPGSCARAFCAPPPGYASMVIWDLVVNCAAETRPGRTDAVHADGTVQLSKNCARMTRQFGAKRYVELSSGNMHASDGKATAATEDCTMEPWTAEARHKATVERWMQAGEDPTMKGLKWTVLRLPLVYGPGDRRGLSKCVDVNQ